MEFYFLMSGKLYKISHNDIYIQPNFYIIGHNVTFFIKNGKEFGLVRISLVLC